MRHDNATEPADVPRKSYSFPSGKGSDGLMTRDSVSIRGAFSIALSRAESPKITGCDGLLNLPHIHRLSEYINYPPSSVRPTYDVIKGTGDLVETIAPVVDIFVRPGYTFDSTTSQLWRSGSHQSSHSETPGCYQVSSWLPTLRVPACRFI